MKWKKLGQIFDFYQTPFKDRFESHAVSPQAIEFDDFVRIYFTTRLKDTEKTFISVPQYVDFSKDFLKILNYSKSNIISRGDPGCFDEHGIFPFSPVPVNNKIYAYISGITRRVSVDADSGIGLAVSDDNGNSFSRLGNGPVLTASLHEPFLVCDGFVRKFDQIFHMWYCYGTLWKSYKDGCEPDRTYIIGHAFSENGIDWTKSGHPVIETANEMECQALPTIIKISDRYYMYFSSRHSFDFRKNPKNSYDLGFAYSDDLTHWTRNDSAKGINRSKAGDWDCDMICYPHIFQVDTKIYLLYNGNEFGKRGFGLAVLEGM